MFIADFSIIYSLKLTHSINLIVPESINDDTLYISRITTTTDDDNDDCKLAPVTVKELRVMTIFETEPMARLSRLLHQGRYLEADEFAKKMNLDRNIVPKFHAEQKMTQISLSTDDVDNLLDLLNLLDDDYVSFKLECCACCIDMLSGQLSDARRLLSYGCSIVPTASSMKQVR